MHIQDLLYVVSMLVAMTLHVRGETLALVYFFILFSCEPDDLCLETYADTPKLIVKFFDSNSHENIVIDNIIVEDNDRNIILFSGSTDSLSVPLNYIRQQTSLNLTYSNNLDKVYINYSMVHRVFS